MAEESASAENNKPEETAAAAAAPETPKPEEAKPETEKPKPSTSGKKKPAAVKDKTTKGGKTKASQVGPTGGGAQADPEGSDRPGWAWSPPGVHTRDLLLALTIIFGTFTLALLSYLAWLKAKERRVLRAGECSDHAFEGESEMREMILSFVSHESCRAAAARARALGPDTITDARLNVFSTNSFT